MAQKCYILCYSLFPLGWIAPPVGPWSLKPFRNKLAWTGSAENISIEHESVAPMQGLQLRTANTKPNGKLSDLLVSHWHGDASPVLQYKPLPRQTPQTVRARSCAGFRFASFKSMVTEPHCTRQRRTESPWSPLEVCIIPTPSRQRIDFHTWTCTLFLAQSCFCPSSSPNPTLV